MSIPHLITDLAKRIQLLICDVDGVLTTGELYLNNTDDEFKAFNVKDGLGIKLLMQNGIEVAVITARRSKVVSRRMQELGVTHLYQGQKDKRMAYQELLGRLDLTSDHVAYVGDDLPDLALMRECALGFAPADAVPFVCSQSDWTLDAAGGRGAVREIAHILLEAQGKLDAIHEEYLNK